MSYSVEYINCKICGSDRPKFLGFRGNLEYMGMPKLSTDQEHMVTSVVKCGRCGFIYTNPKIVLPSEKNLGFYNEPEEYLSSIGQGPLKLFKNTLNLIEKFTKHKGKLLDIGSGKGEFLAVAKIHGWEAFGVEPSKDFVRYANEKYGLDVQNCNLEGANFPESFFDVVTLNMVLEHIENPHALLSAIYKILNKDGLLYIEVPNMNSGLLKLVNLYYRFKEKDWSPLLSPLHPPYHCYGYGKSSLRLLCQLNKFKVKRTFIFGIGLRGFRRFRSGNRLKELVRNLVAKIFGWMKQGDILVALAKNSK